MDPRGVIITNTISSAELAATIAAVAATMLYCYSHTATDSLFSMHQLASIPKPAPAATASRQMVYSNPLPKQFTSHHRPFISITLSPTPALLAVDILTLLLESDHNLL